MKEELFLLVTNMSLAASLVAVAVLVLRFVLKKKVNRWIVYLSWGLVFLRLICPIGPPSAASIFNALEVESKSYAQGSSQMSFVEDRGEQILFPQLNRHVSEDNPQMEAAETPLEPQILVVAAPVNVLTILSTIWLCGFALLLCYGFLCYFVTLHQIKKQSFAVSSPAIQKQIESLKLGKRVGVFQSELFHTPIVCGILHCRILLPMEMDTEDKDVLSNIFTHEAIHIKRWDNLWRMFATLTLYCHWFNPLIWYCYHCFVTDMEVSCDEKVLRLHNLQGRKNYAQTLLDMIAMQQNPLYGGFLSFGESSIKERVRNIMNYKRSTVIISILCVAVVLGLGIVFLTNPQVQIMPDPPMQEEPLILESVIHKDEPKQDTEPPQSAPIIEVQPMPFANTATAPESTPIAVITAKSDFVVPTTDAIIRAYVYQGPEQFLAIGKQEHEKEIRNALSSITGSKVVEKVPEAAKEMAKVVLDLGNGSSTTYVLYDVDCIQVIARKAYGFSVAPASNKIYQGGNIANASNLILGIAARYSPTIPAFFVSSGEVQHIHIYDNKTKTFAKVANADVVHQVAQMINELKPQPAAIQALGASLTEVDNMTFYQYDGKMVKYQFYQKGIVVEDVRTDLALEEPTAYTFVASDYSKLQDIIKTQYTNNRKGSYWLGLMNQNKVSIKSIVLTPTQSDKPAVSQLVTDRVEINEIFVLLQGVMRVDPASYTQINEIPQDYCMQVEINFANNEVYTIGLKDNEVTVFSDSVGYGTRHTTTSGNALEQLEMFAGVTPLPDDPIKANPPTGKPVIYLYPEKQTDVTVKLDFDGTLTYTYPTYNNGWHVSASPDGTLVNLADNSKHYYLFWEGVAKPEWVQQKGSVVTGKDTEQFLVKTLAQMGLTPKEYNDFIVYWVPKMQDNAYNFISFSGEEYNEIAKLSITPQPDSILRVHMMYQPVKGPIQVEPQTFTPFVRKGFTVVEWGGTELNPNQTSVKF